MDYTIDGGGIVLIETTLPEFCAGCDNAEWTLDAGELKCGNARKCAQLFNRLEARHGEARSERTEGKAEAKKEGLTPAAAGVDRQKTLDRLAVDEAKAERSAVGASGTSKEAPVEWWQLPHHLTAKEFAACVGLSRASIGKSFPGDLMKKYGAWAKLPNNGQGRGTKVGVMIDEAALDEWKDRPYGRSSSRAALTAYDEAITWRWVRGIDPLTIAQELGVSRAFVRRRVRDIFEA